MVSGVKKLAREWKYDAVSIGHPGPVLHGRPVGKEVADVVARLIPALEPDDVVLGGGNVKKLKKLPPGCRAGSNANAFLGGFRLWEKGA